MKPLNYTPLKCRNGECAYPFITCDHCAASSSTCNKFVANPHGTYQHARGLDPYISYKKPFK